MKFCLIGCGDIASTMHAPAYRKYQETHPELYLAACCDSQEARAEDMKNRFGFHRHYTDYREMLIKERPDAVTVAVSETASVNVGADVLRAGIPLLIEKPPGRKSEDTLRLVKEAAARNVPCQVAFNRRYMPVISAMREKAPEKIQLITYDMIRWNRHDANFSNTAVHAIDAVRFLAGADYRSVRFTYQEMPEHGPGVCNVLMDCEMTSGARAQIRICPMAGVGLERAGIYADDRLISGFMPVWGGYDTPGRIEDFRKGGAPEITRFSPCEVFESNGFLAENAAFFDALNAGKKLQPDIFSAMNTMFVKECMDQRKAEWRADD